MIKKVISMSATLLKLLFFLASCCVFLVPIPLPKGMLKVAACPLTGSTHEPPRSSFFIIEVRSSWLSPSLMTARQHWVWVSIFMSSWCSGLCLITLLVDTKYVLMRASPRPKTSSFGLKVSTTKFCPSGNTAALLLIDCCMILAYWLYRLVSDATGGMEVAAPPGMEAIGIGMEAIGACMDGAGGTVETAGWEAAPWKGPNPVRTPMFAAAKAAAGGGP